MNLENTLFFMPLLVGAIFTITAFIVLKFPPKKINMLYGYRTNRSMKSQKHWDFAQIYSSKIMVFCGLGLIISSIFGLIIYVSEGMGVFISSIFIMIAVVILLAKTEKAIKQNFTNE